MCKVCLTTIYLDLHVPIYKTSTFTHFHSKEAQSKRLVVFPLIQLARRSNFAASHFRSLWMLQNCFKLVKPEMDFPQSHNRKSKEQHILTEVRR